MSIIKTPASKQGRNLGFVEFIIETTYVCVPELPGINKISPAINYIGAGATQKQFLHIEVTSIRTDGNTKRYTSNPKGIFCGEITHTNIKMNRDPIKNAWDHLIARTDTKDDTWTINPANLKVFVDKGRVTCVKNIGPSGPKIIHLFQKTES